MRHLKITPCNQAVIFARVSSREQEQGASIDAQNDAITNYCAKQNFKIIKSFSITESSTKSSNKKVNRKKFYEMLNYVKGQKHKTAIVVHCVDRLQRTFNEYVELERLLKDDKIEMHFYKEGLVLHKNSSCSDIMRWDMGILSAKMYVGSLKDNVVRSMDFNMSNGKWQSFAPIGYLNTRDCYNKANIEIDPDRAPLVKRLFEEYATGMHSLNSITLLAQELKLSSVKTTSNKPITRNTVYHMLQSHFYYGYMKYDNNLIPHNYKPIIDKITYDKVQLILKGTDKPETKRGYGEVPFIFTGLVRCATCGCAMTPEKHKKKSGKRIYIFKMFTS